MKEKKLTFKPVKFFRNFELRTGASYKKDEVYAIPVETGSVRRWETRGCKVLEKYDGPMLADPSYLESDIKVTLDKAEEKIEDAEIIEDKKEDEKEEIIEDSAKEEVVEKAEEVEETTKEETAPKAKRGRKPKAK